MGTLSTAIAITCAVSGCGGRRGAGGAIIPIRATTAGEVALALLPAGPDVVVEIDLARARSNPLIGPVVDQWIGAAGDAIGDRGLTGDARPPLAGAAWVVLAGYGVGTDDATTITLLAPSAADKPVDIPGGVALADGVVAVAPPAAIERLRAVETGAPSAATDDEFLALRNRAMPSAADGAVVRATARLSPDARIALAGALGLEPAPRAVSAWADVADDAAVIVDLDARDRTDPGATRRLRTALTRLVHQLATDPAVTALGLAPSIARTRFESSPRGSWLRAILLIAPGRLKWAVAQARPAQPDPSRPVEGGTRP